MTETVFKPVQVRRQGVIILAIILYQLLYTGQLQLGWLYQGQPEVGGQALQPLLKKVKICYAQATYMTHANWQWVGVTTGRTRQDRYSTISVPIKDIYVYPLCRDFKKTLCTEEP